MQRPTPLAIGPGQESVWDYPRPPRCEPTDALIEITFAGELIVSTRQAYRVLETSHPPTYYLPPADVRPDFLHASNRQQSFCEWKGLASYWSLEVNGRILRDVGWSYANPTGTYAAIKDHIAFYPDPMDECSVNGERVVPQPGGFYGGWITSAIVGPFKGSPGTMGW
jgi:uncharacterized protein (DUF427 family)